MFVQEADLFKEVSREAIDEIMRIVVEQSCDQGAILFAEGDPADHFFILEEGIISLVIGKEGEISFAVSDPGAAFGWSSLVGRDVYTAKAECETACKLIKIEKESLQMIFERHPESGMAFFKGLAGAIGRRLISTYNSHLSEQSPERDVTYGTGQIKEGTAD
jgi:CRP/FNR family transcriptional regulator, cyclic AMP receptor protein